MNIYLNPSNVDFHDLLNSEVFVDRTLMIKNHILQTISKCLCISRPRIFGKSTNANFLVAYYSNGCDSHVLFKKKTTNNTSRNNVKLYSLLK